MRLVRTAATALLLFAAGISLIAVSAGVVVLIVYLLSLLVR